MIEYEMLRGQEPSPSTIAEGTVYMELHPEYNELVGLVKDLGFEVKPTESFPRVGLERYQDLAGNVWSKNVLYILPGMSFLDLEHEVDHTQQVHSRFVRQGEQYFTHVWVQNSYGYWRQDEHHPQLLKSWQNSIIEYHNRLVEFKRLHERQVSVSVLIAHIRGVDDWSKVYWNRGRGIGRSKTKQAWEERFFWDLQELQASVQGYLL